MAEGTGAAGLARPLERPGGGGTATVCAEAATAEAATALSSLAPPFAPFLALGGRACAEAAAGVAPAVDTCVEAGGDAGLDWEFEMVGAAGVVEGGEDPSGGICA